MQMNRARPLCLELHLMGAGRETALLVDIDPDVLEARWLLMSGDHQSASTLPPRELYEMNEEWEPQIAVLSDTLGPFQLPEVAAYVRRRWPRARILVVGEASLYLEDQLYDENMTGWFSPAEFRAAVERCRHGIH